jgi:hypothetical protein
LADFEILPRFFFKPFALLSSAYLLRVLKVIVVSALAVLDKVFDYGCHHHDGERYTNCWLPIGIADLWDSLYPGYATERLTWSSAKTRKYKLAVFENCKNRLTGKNDNMLYLVVLTWLSSKPMFLIGSFMWKILEFS